MELVRPLDLLKRLLNNRFERNTLFLVDFDLESGQNVWDHVVVLLQLAQEVLEVLRVADEDGERIEILRDLTDFYSAHKRSVVKI